MLYENNFWLYASKTLVVLAKIPNGIFWLVGVLGLCLAQRPNNSAGVGSEYSKLVYYIRSPPTACEFRSRPSAHYKNQKRPKGLFDFYGEAR